MAEVVPEKSHGLKFAEQQLLRHGWEYGKGLGRGENGISEAIKVKVKCGKGGVGHKEGEQFTFHWWDHVFNKASSSLQVDSDQNGIQLKKTAEEDEDDGMISNKKPRKASLAKAKLYGCFVKSATLLSGQEQPEPKASSSDDSSSSDEEEDDDRKLDLSSTTKLSDADLIKACGGRTAHKGARHGLTMSAKLARLEQQEAEFMAKYGKKNQPASAPPVCVTPTPPTSQSADQRAERQEETAEDSQRKKTKKKRSNGSVGELNGDEVSVSPETDLKPKKKKKKKKAREDTEEITDTVSTDGDVIYVGNIEADHSHKTKRKHKKKKHSAEQNEEERAASPAAERTSQEETVELHTKVKRKKRKCEPAEEEEINKAESSQSEPVQDCTPKTKKKKGAVILEEAEVTEEETTVKQKRKKCKKDKSYVEDISSEETLPPKKKKKKKSRE
ncbi:G patch domain-containing protein 4 [Anoplopoma fimbria]|uniref:G patch domain-containing protein 4 n=1 Tax=Anoplopoma fimbria TaxID=229290 RepID=UPI0023EE1D00|nr:G patch domain-containing protein 4 [Anoplopoma fimbria]